MDTTLDFYKDFLESLNFKIEEDDTVSLCLPTGALQPTTVNSRRLVLPTKTWLRKGFGEDYQPFHPLSESLSRKGTSPVLQMLQRAVKANVQHLVLEMSRHLLEIAADQSTHKDLPPQCTDFLKKLSETDKNTVDLFWKITGAAVKKNRFITVYLKNGGTYDGKKVNRLAVIRFPIMEDLQNGKDDVLGVKLSKKHRQQLINLFKLVVPFGDNPEEYAAGTNSRVAPYFTALVECYHKIIKVLNQVINQYAVPLHLAVKPVKLFDIGILETFGKIYSEIPPLSGNEGGKDDTPEEVSETKVATPAPTVKVNVEKPLVAQPRREEVKSSNVVSMSEFMATQYPQQNNMLMATPMMGMNGNMLVSPHMQQPMYMPAAPIPSWQMNQAQQMQMQQPSNPFMQAVRPTVQMGGSLGLI